MVNRMEKFLIRMVVFSLLLVVVSQGLMTADPIRFYMSWSERMEGENLPAPVAAPKSETAAPTAALESPQALLGITLVQYTSLPEVQVLVNGKARYTFSRSSVLMRVNGGDTIEIDAGHYNYPVSFTITSGSANLAFPATGAVFTANQGIVMVGKVIVK